MYLAVVKKTITLKFGICRASWNSGGVWGRGEYGVGESMGLGVCELGAGYLALKAAEV